MTTAVSNRDAISIREAKRVDLLDIYQIEKASFPQPWPYQAFEQFIESSGFLVAATNQRVVGFIVSDTNNQMEQIIGHIKDLAVHPDYRGFGIGSHLIQRSLAVMTAAGARRVKLEVRESNTRARDLYERFGFTPHHTIPNYYDDGEDAVVLTVDLPTKPPSR